MRQTVLERQGVFTIAGVWEDLTLQTDEVLAGVKVVTICGSGSNYFQVRTLPYDLQCPLVLRHEMAGIIRETGIAVSGVQEGDRVTAEPQSYCGHCEAYQRGDCNFCGSL